MKREDFERLKEEEKAHLRELRDLKARLKGAQRVQKVGQALHNIEAAGDLEGFDESLEELNRRAAEQEARLDIVVDGVTADDFSAELELDEEAIQKAKAAAFVNQMKVTMGDTPRPENKEKKVEPSESNEDSVSSEPTTTDPDFEKTIGRMTPRSKDS